MGMAGSRAKMAEWVRAQLVGPSPYMHSEPDSDQDFLKGINPVERFPCGAIYPVLDGEGLDPASSEGAEDGLPGLIAGRVGWEGLDPAAPDDIEALDDGTKGQEDGKEEEPVRHYTPPSSIGLSFFLKGAEASMEIALGAAVYTYGYKRRCWAREKLAGGSTRAYAPGSGTGRDRHDVWGGRAFVDVLWRRQGEGWIVTVSLCNRQDMDGAHSSGHEHPQGIAEKTAGNAAQAKADKRSAKQYSQEIAEKTLFEARIELLVTGGAVGDYPRVDRSLLDDEEQEIEMQYRNRKVYAIGHGTGVGWEAKEDGGVERLWTEAMPQAEAPQITADIGSAEALELRRLARTRTSASRTIAGRKTPWRTGAAYCAACSPRGTTHVPQEARLAVDKRIRIG